MLAIKQQWPNAQIDQRDPAGVWSNAVDPLSAEQIRYGIKRLAKITDDFPITPAQFAAHANAMSELPQPNRVEPKPGEKAVCRQALNAAYAHRVMEHAGLEINIPRNKYHGDFDYMAIVNAAELPDPNNHNHRWYWEQLWTAFDKSWGEAH